MTFKNVDMFAGTTRHCSSVHGTGKSFRPLPDRSSFVVAPFWLLVEYSAERVLEFITWRELEIGTHMNSLEGNVVVDSALA